MIGRALVLVVLPRLVARATGVRIADVLRPMVRPLLAVALVLALFGYAGIVLTTPAELLWEIVAAPACALAAGGVYALVGMSSGFRREVITTLRAAFRRGSTPGSTTVEVGGDDPTRWPSGARCA
jgi:hypothetical protein